MFVIAVVGTPAPWALGQVGMGLWWRVAEGEGLRGGVVDHDGIAATSAVVLVWWQ
jgi:hypothetical protein